MFKYYLILILFFATSANVSGQGTKRNTLSVPKFNEITASELLNKLTEIKNDTSKVWLLNKIAAIYWWRRSDRYNDLDSCMNYALQARQLSNKLDYQEGYNESTFLICRVFAEQEKINQAQILIKKASPEQQVRLNLVLGEHYLNLPGSLKSNVNKGYPFLYKALRLGQSYNLIRWKQESQIAIGKYYFLSDDLKRGISSFKNVIDYWHQVGNISEEAHWYSELGRYMPGGPENLILSIKYQKQALDLYKRINAKPDMAYTADDIGQLYYEQLKNLDSAQLYSSMAIGLLKEAKVTKLYKYYYHLSDVFLEKGNFSQALSYSLAALDNIEKLKDNRMKGIVYNGLGEIYSGLGDKKNSLRYFELAMEQLTETGTYLVFYLAKNITDNLIMQGKFKEAIAFTQKFEKENPGNKPEGPSGSNGN
ncbi:tetratricopeptide repeat protein [Pedobacter sp. NJ-S-72]